MPAAALIPAPIACIKKVVAVKKNLVVGFLLRMTGPPLGVHLAQPWHLHEERICT